ncbi:Protein CURVATURE THYLAKOID 1A, chloroplastic [Linum perenne]
MAATICTAATSSTASLLLPVVRTSGSSSSLPFLPPRSSSSSRFFSTASAKHLSSKAEPRFSSLKIRASSSEETSVDTNEIFSDLKDKWDALENKSTVLLYGGGGIVGVWLSSTLVGAINSVPLLPKVMELVGLVYTGWFVYRYLLFKQGRKELATDIETLKKKIAGSE